MPTPSRSAPPVNPNTAASASERAAQAIEAMRLKARAAATPPSKPQTFPATKPAPRRRAPQNLAAALEPESALNTRRRLKAETRVQLIERLNNPLLTLQETSVVLGVCPATVRRYSNSGLLRHVRTEGNQRRFRWRDVEPLMREMELRRRQARRK